MAHRYLYYVLDAPVISDYEYDMLEKKAFAELPKTSPVFEVGSSLKSSYSDQQIALATQFQLGETV